MADVLEGDAGAEDVVDGLLAELDKEAEEAAVQAEADRYAVELFRERLATVDQDSPPTLGVMEAHIRTIEELYSVQPKPLSEDAKIELRTEAIERSRTEYQRLRSRARVQLATGNAAGLAETEAAMVAIREAVTGLANV